MGNSSYFNFLEWLFVNCKRERESMKGASHIKKMINIHSSTSENKEVLSAELTFKEVGGRAEAVLHHQLWDK